MRWKFFPADFPRFATEKRSLKKADSPLPLCPATSFPAASRTRLFQRSVCPDCFEARRPEARAAPNFPGIISLFRPLAIFLKFWNCHERRNLWLPPAGSSELMRYLEVQVPRKTDGRSSVLETYTPFRHPLLFPLAKHCWTLAVRHAFIKFTNSPCSRFFISRCMLRKRKCSFM